MPLAREGAGAVSTSHRVVIQTIAAAFPTVPLLPVVGNHDTWPYFSGGAAGVAAANELAELTNLPADVAEQFRTRGYYCCASPLARPTSHAVDLPVAGRSGFG